MSRPIRLFGRDQKDQALQHVAEGGQALVVVKWPGGTYQGMNIRLLGYLYDQDKDRLYKWCRDAGIKRICLEHVGKPNQHSKLVLGPLNRALCQTDNPEDLYAAIDEPMPPDVAARLRREGRLDAPAKAS